MNKLDNLNSKETYNGFEFELVKEDNFYHCRGKVMYDDEHDEIPEPGLWEAALKLKQYLETKGFTCYVSHSEKGWVEVGIIILDKL